MADILVKSKATGELIEMSEYQFQLLRHDYVLAEREPKKPVFEAPKTPDPPQGMNAPEQPKISREDLVKRYEVVFGEAPHGRMKDETILEKIKEQEKNLVDISAGPEPTRD